MSLRPTTADWSELAFRIREFCGGSNEFDLAINRAFVTGGAGFIGSHVVDRLARDGAHVTIYDNFSTGQEQFVGHHAGNPKGQYRPRRRPRRRTAASGNGGLRFCFPFAGQCRCARRHTADTDRSRTEYDCHMERVGGDADQRRQDTLSSPAAPPFMASRMFFRPPKAMRRCRPASTGRASSPARR